MREILMMMLPSCPYCRMADQMLEELMEENPEYQKVKIRRVNEEEDTALANSLDYYYVPCFFVGGVKALEGVPTKDALEQVLKRALAQEESR